MSKYIIDVGDAYAKHICGKGDMLCLPVRINEFEEIWLNTNIPLTPYTEPDIEKAREEAYAQGYSKGFTNAKVQCNLYFGSDGIPDGASEADDVGGWMYPRCMTCGRKVIIEFGEPNK